MSIRRVNDGFKWIMQREALDNFINRTFSHNSVASGATTDITTQGNMVVCISGYMYSLASYSGIPSVAQGSGYSTIASGKACRGIFGVNSAGEVKIFLGSAVSGDSYTPYIGVFHTSCAPLATILFSLASNVSVTIGTTSLAGAVIKPISMIPQGVIIQD